MISRDRYLQKLIRTMHNGRIKIITGIRRCGKSWLLFRIFRDYLLSTGVEPSHIVEIALDKQKFVELRDPRALYDYMTKKISQGGERFYIFIDEIQMAYRVKMKVDALQVAEEDRGHLYMTFYDVLNNYINDPNVDIYVTGSNSRMLSSDVLTNFRDRGCEVRLHPLSFGEYYAYMHEKHDMDKWDAWSQYIVYGGMPLGVLARDDKERADYLIGLYRKLYYADLIERYNIRDDEILDKLVDLLSSSIGSLTNPRRLANAMNSTFHAGTTDKTIRRYIEALEDAFIFSKARRYDVKGKGYFDYPVKYYAEDVGLRNARLNFRQIEETYLMENIIYNELIRRGYMVDVGAIKIDSGMHEIDFVVNMADKRIYIQSALSIVQPDKAEQESASLLQCRDAWPKWIITGGNALPHCDENGIYRVGVLPFLLSENILGD